jgi:NAD(P)H-dependent FMN reductase
MIDSEYNNYARKPVSLIGVSSGSWGGVRACEALLPICHRIGLVNIRTEMYFPRVQDTFQDNGQMKPEFTEQYTTNVQKVYDELIWFAKALKAAKEQQ